MPRPLDGALPDLFLRVPPELPLGSEVEVEWSLPHLTSHDTVVITLPGASGPLHTAPLSGESAGRIKLPWVTVSGT